jgi:hypothetical protein
MANGGIIGPNVVIQGTTTTQSFTASGTFTWWSRLCWYGYF